MLSVIIPTRNRPQFLKRAVSYYRKIRFPYPILIEDSSEPAMAEQTSKMVRSDARGLECVHQIHPVDTHVLVRIRSAAESVKTPFAVVGADDDFFIPKGLEQATRFLQKHPDYSGVHGDAALFGLRSGVEYGPMAWIVEYGQRSLEQETGFDRLLENFQNYSTTWYSMQRTEELLGRMRVSAGANLDNSFLELLPSGLTALQGKVKKLNGLYMVRQSHVAMTSGSRDLLDWLSGEEWASQFRWVQERLSECLQSQDRISSEEAARRVKKVFWAYLTRQLTNFWRKKYVLAPRRKPSLARRIGLKIPGLQKAWRSFQFKMPRPKDQISLEAFLKLHSVHHSAFLPIYQVVTDISARSTVPSGEEVAVG
ncbi:MAG: TIGR00180 family glycosyltransferase [Candidatus Omnitrophica bacterium]|nr:TIGR00180 family glycosyltransferase [Candidatus Omnitrophota bacterium]